jgi:[ribosomal protein S5]-alanine N-acetyltransferase
VSSESSLEVRHILTHATNLAIVATSPILVYGDIKLRVAKMRDAKELEKLILGNRTWLRPWEATNPEAPNAFDVKGQLRGLLRQLDDQSGMPFVIEVQGQLQGQLNVANVMYGSVSSAVLGYWVSPEVAGRGVMPTAVALVTDYLMNQVGLHRVEINIRPENTASLRVVQKLGFRYEGLKQRYIHINGDWRDHYVFALTKEELPQGLLNSFVHGEIKTQKYPWN